MWQRFYHKNDSSYVNRNIPKGFLYTNFSDRIPSSFHLDYKDAENFVTNSDRQYYDHICKSTGENAQVLTYFKEKLGDCRGGGVGCGGYLTRNAMICGNKYVISESSLGGYPVFGPFDIQN